MACFITPLIAGIVVSLVKRVLKGSTALKLNVLEWMLLGGALVLAAEHAWHGELVPYPPFLTAMKNPEDMPTLLSEVSVVGGSMTLATTVLWFGLLAVSRKLELKTTPPKKVISTLGNK